jgi:hypothetical protein
MASSGTSGSTDDQTPLTGPGQQGSDFTTSATTATDQLFATQGNPFEARTSEGTCMSDALRAHGRGLPVTSPPGPTVQEAPLQQMGLAQVPAPRRPQPEVFDSGVALLPADLRHQDRPMTLTGPLGPTAQGTPFSGPEQQDPALHPSDTADTSPVPAEPQTPRVCIMAQNILRDWIRDADTELGQILTAIRRHAKPIHSCALAMKND